MKYKKNSVFPVDRGFKPEKYTNYWAFKEFT